MLAHTYISSVFYHLSAYKDRDIKRIHLKCISSSINRLSRQNYDMDRTWVFKSSKNSFLVNFFKSFLSEGNWEDQYHLRSGVLNIYWLWLWSKQSVLKSPFSVTQSHLALIVHVCPPPHSFLTQTVWGTLSSSPCSRVNYCVNVIL